MTEQEWLTTTDPVPMLTFLRSRASERKARLFLVACARSVWEQIVEPVMRVAVEVGESAADGHSSSDELRAQVEKMNWWLSDLNLKPLRPWNEVLSPEVRSLAFTALHTVLPGHVVRELNPGIGFGWASAATAQHQPRLLRELIGNPFRPVACNPEWLTTDVVSLGHGIYEEKAFDRMPILADALQDAGCTNDDVLNHCRDASAAHARGCWVLDLLLGKK